MLLTDEIKELIPKAPLVPLATVTPHGEPHLIVVGKVKEIREDDLLVFGIYKMAVTQQNLKQDDRMQAVIASRQDGPKGYRLSGRAGVEGKDLLFKIEKVDELL